MRFGELFEGLVILCGSIGVYHPVSPKEQSRLHRCGKKVLPGIFLGYALYAVRILSGDLLVADTAELENLDASGSPCSEDSVQRT